MRGHGRVFVVGGGPGDPGLLTIRALDVLRHADVLFYDAVVNDAILSAVPASCERTALPPHRAIPQEEINALMIREARAGKSVVRLKVGDPFVFGHTIDEACAMHDAGVAFEIVPGVSAAIAVPAYAGIPMTQREVASAFAVVSGRADPADVDWARFANPHCTLVVLMPMNGLDAIARRLIASGRAASTPAAVIADGTAPTQRTVTGTLETIAHLAAQAHVESPALAVIGEVVSMREELRWFDRRTLFGKRVLVTRPAHQADEFARALYARGVEPILASTIAIAPPDRPRAAYEAIDRLASFAWIVFTSQNGVDAFFDRLSALDTDARYVGRTRVAAIGTKTEHRLREHGVRADLVPSAFISEEIGRALIEASRDGDEILIFRAQEARDVLPQMLREAGRRPLVVAAYKTLFEADPAFAEKVGRADVLTFTSASTVRGFAQLLGGNERAAEAATGKIVACIGPITAEAARQAGLRVDVTADVYTTDGLLDALEAHLALSSNV
jgi:uroporphyrinogen III methyltransferase/synthase